MRLYSRDGRPKLKQKPNRHASCCKVSDDLADFISREKVRQSLFFHDDFLFDKMIDVQRTDLLVAKLYSERPLWCEVQTIFLHRLREGAMVVKLSQARTKIIVNLHGAANDSVSEVLMRNGGRRGGHPFIR